MVVQRRQDLCTTRLSSTDNLYPNYSLHGLPVVISELLVAVLMATFVSAFSASTGNVYLTGLAIAGYTYGALLGASRLGRLVRGANQLVAFMITMRS